MNYTENPPAFPISHNGSTLPSMHGLTMRDYFAAMAMQSMLLTVKREQDVESINIAAYRIADAMLKARCK
jgi:hypothetical protein